MAPRNTLNSGTGLGHWRPGRAPPRTVMESARRPISAVPWSMRRRSSKTSGLRPWNSSISRSSAACWWTIDWTRRAMFTKARCADSRLDSSSSRVLRITRSSTRCVSGRSRCTPLLSTTLRITSMGPSPCRSRHSASGRISRPSRIISPSWAAMHPSRWVSRCAYCARSLRMVRPRRTASMPTTMTMSVATAPHEPTASRAGSVTAATAAPVAAAMSMAGSNSTRV